MQHTRGVRSAHGQRLRHVLLVSQVALSFALVYTAGLFARTLANLRSVDAGFDSDQVTVVRVHFDGVADTGVGRQDLRRQVLELIRSVPGVAAAAEVRHVPFGGTGSSADVWPDGADPGTGTVVRLNAISDGYLETMQISLIAGRDLTQLDDAGVALVNPTLSRILGITGSPIGTRFRMEGVERSIEIVGLIPDTKYFTLREDPVPILFVPKASTPDPRSLGDFVVRSSDAPDRIASAIASAIAQLDPGVRTEGRALNAAIEDGLARERLLALLSVLFGLLAAAVAAVGLYGTLSYDTTQRASELAVRIALGAGRFDVLTVALRQGVIVVLVGLALGASLALAGATRARGLLFGLDPFEPASLGIAGALFGAVALLACVIPAQRALRTTPRVALD